MKQHVKQLKELQNFNISLEGDIETILDNPREWAEKVAEDIIMKEMPRYSKAKNLGEKFARKIVENGTD